MKKIPLLFFATVFFLYGVVTGTASELKEVFRTHVSILASDSLQGRGLGTNGADKARDYIIGQFLEAGIKPIAELNGEYKQHFSFRQGLAWVSGYNIAGMVEGTDPELKDEYIVIGAHYDHLGYKIDEEEKIIYPGADDNASGVAAIIEIGRYFAARPELLKRSLIIVAFDAEESGLLGSGHFAANSPVPLDNIKLMFSFDMVGMYETHKGLDLKGMGSVEEGAWLAEQFASEHDIKLQETGSKIARRTDTDPFAKNGIPAVHVFTGSKSPYHKPEDKYDLLDYEGMVKIHTFMIDFVAALSTLPEITPDSSVIAYGQPEEASSKKRLITGLTSNLGAGYHRYNDEFYRANSLFSASGGFYLQVPLNRMITMQQELLYDFNRSKIEGGKFQRHSVAFPLNLQFGSPRVRGNEFRFYIFGGAYYRYSFGGKAAGNTLNFDVFEQQEWGYSYGLGLEVFRFSIGFTHRSALTGLLIDQTVRIKPVNNYFSVGYRF